VTSEEHEVLAERLPGDLIDVPDNVAKKVFLLGQVQPCGRSRGRPARATLGSLRTAASPPVDGGARASAMDAWEMGVLGSPPLWVSLEIQRRWRHGILT
jgi:hypothetical protein